MTVDIKELFFENDVRKHQQEVGKKMVACAKRLLDKGMSHDASKLSNDEKKFYVEPVWRLNTENVEYGSEEYKRLTAQMGAGLRHHLAENDHHPEFFYPYSVQTLNDPIRAMDLFALIEMICDWIAAAERKGNSPGLAADVFEKKYHVDEQLMAVLRNTLGIIGGW